MPTLVCVPIMVEAVEGALRDAAAAKVAGADLVEFRIDHLFAGEPSGAGDSRETRDVLRLAAESPLPCVVTCRSAREGGEYDGPDDARVALYERLGTAFGRLPDGTPEHPPRYLDAELSTWERSANIRQKLRLAVEHPEQIRDLRTSLILSVHDLAGRPTDLSRRLAAMRAVEAARVLKVAFRCRSIRDNLELLDLLAERDRPMIALGMGEFGLLSRVLAPKFGGFLTFASLRPEAATAPGQPTIHELFGLYRFRTITASTQVLGVVGYPLGHSLSPMVHNAGLGAIGADAVYVPLPIVGDDSGGGSEAGYASLKATLPELVEHRSLGFRGASVTIPHKENLVRLAREQGWAIEPEADAIGAGNTIVVDRDASGRPERVTIANTDAPAIAVALEPVLGSLGGARVVVVGAGGTARAAAWGLASRGALVTVHARRAERAAALAESLAGSLDSGAVCAGPVPEEYDALVNCTPVGLHGGPAPDAVPVAVGALRPGAVVMDAVYRPIETPLLRAAREKGSRTIDGMTMFVLQAEDQFRRFTGTPPPACLFERVARDAG
ncbi:MAG: type I 3-dehydroquinate dehydratase [Phycisphaerae bacterium]|nr:type I 3-dehydroquinate dehydratase [Phycisphaerae bacterium]